MARARYSEGTRCLVVQLCSPNAGLLMQRRPEFGGAAGGPCPVRRVSGDAGQKLASTEQRTDTKGK